MRCVAISNACPWRGRKERLESSRLSLYSPFYSVLVAFFMAQTLLIIDDDSSQRKSLSMLALKRLPLKVMESSNGSDALDLIRQDHTRVIAAVILDLHMPKMSGFEFMDALKDVRTDLPVIMITASQKTQDAVEAMKRGAADFISKPIEPERFIVSVTNALKRQNLEHEVQRLTRQTQGTQRFEDMIGYEDGLSSIITVARKAAATHIPVLISGETGTGKEILARAIHGESTRHEHPFVAINCGAIPEQLIESTLFGHEKGAFTGAVTKAIGKFREAEGGTIFLDEVGELPADAQVKLLRVLQEKEVEPVGAGQTLPVDVRIIAATHRDLSADVKAGRFREDLFFRLNVLQIHMPALRDRAQDIPALAYHFIRRFAAQEKRLLRRISDTAMTHLQQQPWTGNVRELENKIHRAMVLSDHPELQIDDFSSSSLSGSSGSMHSPDSKRSSLFLTHNQKLKTLEAIEIEVIRHAIDYCGGNVSRAADELGVAKSTLYRKLETPSKT